MTTTTLDAAMATSLAGLDPSLASLPRALQSCSRPGSWKLHDVRWTPGNGCRLAYVDAMGDHELFAVEVSGDEWGRYGWRDDTALPALRVAADPDEVARRLELVLGEPVEVSVEPVRYRPGSRCVLRYDVVGASGRTTFFAKALQPDAYERIVALHAQPAVHEDSTGLVAEMVAFWADLNVAVGRAIEGRSASSVLNDPDVPTEAKIRLGHDLGDLLARFHDLPVESDTTWSADQHVITLADTMAAVECADPAIGIRLGAVLDSLTATMPAPGTTVLGHGSFRAGQVVVTADGRPVLLDVDEVRHSDREQDLGVALAHLTWQGIRHPHQHQELVEIERALLAAYEATAGEVRPDALRWWKAAGLLQVAVRRFRRLEVSAWSITNQLAEAAEDLLLDPLASQCHRGRPARRRPGGSGARRRQPPVRSRSTRPSCSVWHADGDWSSDTTCVASTIRPPRPMPCRSSASSSRRLDWHACPTTTCGSSPTARSTAVRSVCPARSASPASTDCCSTGPTTAACWTHCSTVRPVPRACGVPRSGWRGCTRRSSGCRAVSPWIASSRAPGSGPP